MKKTLLYFAMMTGFISVSQAQKGAILVYGVAGIQTEKKPNDDKTTTFNFYPGVGYQFAEKWTAGVTGGYGQEKFNPTTGTDTKSTTYKAGGFARYTHVFNNIFNLYGQGEVYYHGTKDQDIKSNGLGVSVTPSVGINVSKGFMLNISFGGISYETIKIKDASDGTNTFGVNFGQEIGIGFSKNFGGKK